MSRIFKWSRNALLAFIPMFFFGILFAVTFGEGTLLGDFGTALIGAVMCTAPLVGLAALLSGIGNLVERYARPQEKFKNDFLADIEQHPDRLQQILNQLSPKDRAYLQQQLASRKLGVSDDGELMSLDELMAHEDSEDENRRSLFTG